jgi:predicted dehydrogenase
MSLHFGIIGTGAIGLEHIANLSAIPEARVVAIADTNEGSRKRALKVRECLQPPQTHFTVSIYFQVLSRPADRAARMEGEGASSTGSKTLECAVYTDYNDLLKDQNVPIVIICTPNFHHIHVIRAAVAAGKHILCEKPMCTRMADCREVELLVASYDKMFWVGMEYRYIPSIARLIREVEGGAVGKVQMLSIREHRFPFLIKVHVNISGSLFYLFLQSGQQLESVQPEFRRDSSGEMLPFL